MPGGADQPLFAVFVAFGALMASHAQLMGILSVPAEGEMAPKRNGGLRI